jgi:hypothetical protein
MGSSQGQGLWILSCEKHNQLAFGMSVKILSCPAVLKIMHQGHLKYLAINKAENSPYNIFSLGETLDLIRQTV